MTERSRLIIILIQGGVLLALAAMLIFAQIKMSGIRDVLDRAIELCGTRA